VKSLDLQILVSFHLFFAAVFVGSNVFLDFLLTPRLDLIPPGQAARLGDKLGTDFAWLNWAALIGSPLSGILLLWRLGDLPSLLDPSFLFGGYGIALLSMITLWFTLIITAAILTFYLRPRVVVKLPYDASRQQVEGSRTDAMDYAKWMQRLARYNVIASTIIIVIGGFLRFGGFGA
jgi:uncharacterized membrane protein